MFRKRFFGMKQPLQVRFFGLFSFDEVDQQA
jgi:hypothetical protein